MSTARNMFDLDGRTALITGGSRGLGLQMAEALGDYGARLLISARKSDELEKAQAHLKARGIEVDWFAADSGKEDSIASLVDAGRAAGRSSHDSNENVARRDREYRRGDLARDDPAASAG